MENASKALIIAGSILIAIMIVSLGILVFNNMGNSAKNMANMDKQQIAAFNSKITPYLGEAISGSQVNALLQYCLSVNMAAKQSGETYKCITVEGATSLSPGDTSYKRVTTSGTYYKVKGIYDSNGLITKITISNP
jgi:hypothetical protein